MLKSPKRRKFLSILAGVTIVLAMAMGAFFTGAQVIKSQKWDPLAQYPVQQVVAERESSTPLPGGENYEEDVTIPVYYWNEEVEVEATKCVKVEEDIVQVEGNLAWVSDEPPGRIIDAGTGVGPRGPGCVNYSYRNPIPDNVKAELEELKEQGIEQSEWHLGGTEIPIEEGSREGAPRSWITITFRIIHEDAPTVEGE